jgi:hypothetical protein
MSFIAEVSAGRQLTDSYDRQKSAFYRNLWLTEYFSSVSNPFGSILSLVIPMGERQQTSTIDLLNGIFWSAHRQSKIDFGRFWAVLRDLSWDQ